MKEILYATSNPGKQKEVGKYLSQQGIKTIFPKDLGLNINPEESGNSLEENAIIKWLAFSKAASNPELVIVSDDTGVEIESLGGEPGIHVRRWKGYRMDDEEIIDYCLERMKNISDNKRSAKFRTAIVVGANGAYKVFAGYLEGEIVKSPIPLRIEGFPFESIFYITQYGKMLGEIHQMSSADKQELNFLSHRERAFSNALPYIKELLN